MTNTYHSRVLYKELAQAIQAKRSCGPTHAWYERWAERIKLLTDMLPHGAGFDAGTSLDESQSHADKVIFHTSFHHMNDAGYYDGWTEHTVTVTPSLIHGINLRVSGRNRNEIKDHIAESFDYILRSDVTYELLAGQFPELKVSSAWEDKDGQASQCYQAWYSNGVRFWNDFNGARDHAAILMDEKFYDKGGK